MSVGPIVAALSGIPAGQLVDRYGARSASLVALGGVTSGALALALTREAHGVLGYVLPIAAMTASYALFQASNSTQLMRNATREQRTAVSGTLNLSRNLGLLLGASVMGAVFARSASSVGGDELTSASPTAIAHGLHVTFAVATSLAALAIATVAFPTLRTQDPAAYERQAW